MLNLDPDLDGSGCSALSFRGPAPHLLYFSQRPSPPDSEFFFRCSFLGPDFSQMVLQSEYSSDLGAKRLHFGSYV